MVLEVRIPPICLVDFVETLQDISWVIEAFLSAKNVLKTSLDVPRTILQKNKIFDFFMIFMILDLIFQLSPASPSFLWSTGNGFDHSAREVPETYLELQESAEILRIKSGHVYYDPRI